MFQFELSGVLRRIRRAADLSQRELGRQLGIPKSTVAAAEAGTRDLPVGVLALAAELARLRLVLVDTEGREIPGMAEDTVRDMGLRRFPAHLDTRYSDQDWWHGEERRSRPQPWYTFDRVRETRDHGRGGSAHRRITSFPSRVTPPRTGPSGASTRSAAAGPRRGNGPSWPASSARNAPTTSARARRSATRSQNEPPTSTSRPAPVGAIWHEPLLPWARARQPPP